ncbi:unnamed protein product, partial [Chrysoparadoxa australica]
ADGDGDSIEEGAEEKVYIGGEAVDDMLVATLRAHLEDFGLPTGGRKAQLLQRLKEALASSAQGEDPAAQPLEEDKGEQGLEKDEGEQDLEEEGVDEEEPLELKYKGELIASMSLKAAQQHLRDWGLNHQGRKAAVLERLTAVAVGMSGSTYLEGLSAAELRAHLAALGESAAGSKAVMRARLSDAVSRQAEEE